MMSDRTRLENLHENVAKRIVAAKERGNRLYVVNHKTFVEASDFSTRDGVLMFYTPTHGVRAYAPGAWTSVRHLTEEDL